MYDLTKEQEKLESIRINHASLMEDLRWLKDCLLEINYHLWKGRYFGKVLRGMQLVEVHLLDDVLEVELTDEEFGDVLLIDLLLAGTVRRLPNSPDIFVAAEISWTVDSNDIECAVRRANLLRRAGYRVVPACAGREISDGDREVARKQNVFLIIDEQVFFWAEALNRWENI
jgi:hypothetical protein